MKKTIREVEILTGILIAALLALSVVPSSYCSPTNTITIYFDPQTYVFSSSTPVGTKFNVTIWVNSTEYPWNLMMFQVYVIFNASLVNVTELEGVSGAGNIRAWPNENLGGRSWDEQYVFYGQSGGAIGNPVYYDLGDGMGAVMLGDLVTGDLSIDGPKKLCAIEFEIKVVPPEGSPPLSCDFTLNPSPDTILYTSEGEITDIILGSGQYVVPEFSMCFLLALMVAVSFTVIYIKKSRMIRNDI